MSLFFEFVHKNLVKFDVNKANQISQKGKKDEKINFIQKILDKIDRENVMEMIKALHNQNIFQPNYILSSQNLDNKINYLEKSVSDLKRIEDQL